VYYLKHIEYKSYILMKERD